MGKHQQRPFCGEHPHIDAGQGCDVVAPDAAGIHRDGGVEVALFARDKIAGVYSAYRVTLLDESGDGGMEPHLSAVEFGVQHICGAQAERVHAAVGHPHRAGDVGIDRRLQPFGQVGVDDFCADAGFAAGFHKRLLISEVVFWQGDEQAVGLVYAVRGDAAQDHVLLDALFCRFGVVHRITGTGVQQAVIAAGGAGGDVAPLYEQGLQAAHCAVAHGTGPGDATAYYDNIKFVDTHMLILSGEDRGQGRFGVREYPAAACGL